MTLENDLAQIRNAALAAVDPRKGVRMSLQRPQIAQALRGDEGRLLLLGVGKAAIKMTEAALSMLGDEVSEGIVVTKYDHATDHTLPSRIRLFEAGHPVPDAAGLRGASAVRGLLATTKPQDRVLLLLSGGGSSLLSLPVDCVPLVDLQTTTELLLRSGATIGELNAVRKHLSQLKGGQLARHAAPAPIVTLILSDVVGDRLDIIASGPTAPDPTTFEDAWAVLARYGLLDAVPTTVLEYLQAGQRQEQPETPKPGAPLFDNVRAYIVGSNRSAAQSAVESAEELGYRSLLLTTYVEGEAREVAKVAAALVKGLVYHGVPCPPPACLVWGGETTVTVRGQGKGGRNQELALAAALEIAGLENVALMALATDGTDGPTDAAGAIVDGKTLKRAEALGKDPVAALKDNDAYPFLDAVGALLRTGPTGTNVNDLLVILVKGKTPSLHV